MLAILLYEIFLLVITRHDVRKLSNFVIATLNIKQSQLSNRSEAANLIIEMQQK